MSTVPLTRSEIEQAVVDFVKQFEHNELSIKPNARTVPTSNPLSGEEDTLGNVVGQLIARFEQLSDAVALIEERLHSSMGDPKVMEQMEEAVRKRSRHLKDLHDLIHMMRANGFVEDGTERELEKLRLSKTHLETEVNQLSSDLKKCRDDFKAYKNRVQPLRRGRTETGGTEEAPSQ